MLYNISKDLKHPSGYLVTTLAICGVFVFGAGISAGCVLWPRLRSKEPPVSLLYFNHTARAHATDSSYIDALLVLTSDPEALVKEIAAQGWANSHVAHKKYLWGGYAVRCLLVALLFLAVSATLRVTHLR
ncbi:Pycsar system effector family protein [Streptomyces xylophagus]|uniref:Pycsar system effector family protein n=1 Tax=Streptomyces xylophagus TaxID=285514 RepID=UPI003899DDD4